MDARKTGELISSARKEKGLTQAGLADILSVSDRAVSRWERGVGFPDISLLEPLSDALGLTPLDLLRGEKADVTDADSAVSETLCALQEKRRQTRRTAFRNALKSCALFLVLTVFMCFSGFIQIPIDRTETAYIYRGGSPAEVTEVYIEGRIIIRHPWKWEYRGRFAAACAPGSVWEGLTVTIPVRPWSHAGYRTHTTLDTNPGWIRGETGLQNSFCTSSLLREFAAETESGDIIATSPEMYERYVEAFGGPDSEITLFEEPDLTNDPRAQFGGGYVPDL